MKLSEEEKIKKMTFDLISKELGIDIKSAMSLYHVITDNGIKVDIFLVKAKHKIKTIYNGDTRKFIYEYRTKKYKEDVPEDFVKPTPTNLEYVRKIRKYATCLTRDPQASYVLRTAQKKNLNINKLIDDLKKKEFQCLDDIIKYIQTL